MDRTFSKSMVWLHSWAGVIMGSVLFAIFWMGTLSVFDAEIDRWMMPQTRLPAATQPVSLDRIARGRFGRDGSSPAPLQPSRCWKKPTA